MLSFLYRTFLVAMVADCGTLAKCLGKPRLVFFISFRWACESGFSVFLMENERYG